MRKETYIKMTGKIRENDRRVKLTKFVNRILTGFVFLIYPVFLLQLFVQKNPFLLRSILVPFFSFVGVSVFRKLLNAPRPYEKFGVPPVLEKDTPGKSFPSRHVFSVFMIAATIFCLYPDAGIVIGGIGVLLGIIRIVGGVHEPRDVIAGAAAGILCGVAGYYLIP